ncbi:MAG: phytanoyl-CoA dioxygenase family protein [Pseudomonadota bacterium]|nr:phytanoyl-CoA dioxygenase family protein [Pseudomonadota bacterium]
MRIDKMDGVVEQFETLGFVHLPGFFSKPLMDHLSDLIIDHFGEAPDYEHDAEFIAGAKTEIVPWFPQREGVADFDEIEEDPEFRAVTSALIGSAFETQYCMVMFSKAGTSGQAWHQDCPPEDSRGFNLNRLIYTSDIEERIGGQIVIVPGSHKTGVISAGDPHEDLPGQIVLKPNKGDLVLLHGHCWHRVLPIKTKYRFSTNFRAAPSQTPDDITDICVYRNMRYRFSTSEVLEAR